MKIRKEVAGKMGKILLVFLILAVLAAVSEHWNPVIEKNGVLRRNPKGEGAYEVELSWQTEDGQEGQSILLQVPEQGYDAEEEQRLLEAAREEIAATFPGTNESVNDIRTDVCIRESYQNGAVTAEWSFDSYAFITAEGKLENEDAPAEGTIVEAEAELCCQSRKEQYTFYFCIYPPNYSEEEQLARNVEQLVQKEAARNGQEALVLPETAEGKTILWDVRRERTPEKLLLLGILIALCVPLVEKSKREEWEKQRKELLTLEYPELVSRLTILMGAGMSVFVAWRRITGNYTKKRELGEVKEHPLYEEMKRTCHEIESGVSEARALERFGDRIGLHRYRKFCSLVTQNLRKGTRGLGLLLEQEAADAFEERKNLAKKYGEEAGTKLLLPMMIMFGIVVVIIMVPAMMSMQ